MHDKLLSDRFLYHFRNKSLPFVHLLLPRMIASFMKRLFSFRQLCEALRDSYFEFPWKPGGDYASRTKAFVFQN